MSLDRREFLLSAAALATAAPSASSAGPEDAGPGLPASIRADFPSASVQTYFNSAGRHPLSVPVSRTMEQYLAFRLKGPGEGRARFGGANETEVKQRFAKLINADSAAEIAFVQSTSDGENVVVQGLDLPRRRGNVVLDNLHYPSSLYLYKMLEAKGLELRVVKHRNWGIDTADMERAIDKNTRLVSIALVSNVNGYMHEARKIADIAHAHGAYLYGDIIQAVGAVPVDVRAMGIDFAAASTHKWLMAEPGFGFLYVRQDLQEGVLPTPRYGHRQARNFDRDELTWQPVPGAVRYETGNIAEALATCVGASMQYIERLGLANIQAHAKRLTARLQRELPALGYPSLSPKDSGTPIVSFRLKDAAATSKKVRDAGIVADFNLTKQRMRLSVSVFNNDADIDRLLSVLAG